jgi:hypothetical protein
MTNDVSVLDINLSDAKRDGNRCRVVKVEGSTDP